jgi:hypothetical protein
MREVKESGKKSEIGDTPEVRIGGIRRVSFWGEL